MSIPSIVLDLIVLVIIISNIIHYARKGLVAGLVDIIGGLVSAIVAFITSRWLAQLIFTNLLREGLVRKAVNVLSYQGVSTLDQLLANVLDFLPKAAVSSLTQGHAQAISDASQTFAEAVVDGIVAPAITPLIAVVLFIVIFLLLWLLLRVIGKALKGINRIPLVGGLNRILGAFAGVLISGVYVFLLLCSIWSIDAIYGSREFSQKYFSDSITYNLTLPLDVFNNDADAKS